MENVLGRYRARENLTQEQLGALLGVNAPAISKWEHGRVPAERVLAVEKATGIPRHRLRPDLYPAPDSGTEAGAPVSHEAAE